MVCLKPAVAIQIQTGTSSECASSFFNFKGPRLWITVGRSYGTALFVVGSRSDPTLLNGLSLHTHQV